MKEKAEKILKEIIGKKKIAKISKIRRAYKYIYTNGNKFLRFYKSIKNVEVVDDNIEINKFDKLLKLVEIDKKCEQNFYYNIDFTKSFYSKCLKFGNFSIDYSIILNNSLEAFKKQLTSNNEKFNEDELNLLEIIEQYLDRIIDNIDGKSVDIIKNNLNSIKSENATSFQNALQRILFFNMLLWQTDHRLNGLGRLDKMLIKYYNDDIKKGILTEEKAKDLLKEFLLLLHKDYKMKSNSLLGDTGQIIELGGIDSDGSYLCNDLTYIFIELMEELKIPDPKVLVRVSKNMPRELMEKSLKCISTGIGCPLFANDDIIINKLINYGYKIEDAYNYGTSACWEPYIIGKSSAQNNIKSLNFMTPFYELLENEDLNKIENINELIEIYKNYLKKYVNGLCLQLNEISFEKDSLLSLFIEDCLKNGVDISLGGAKYNDFGLTGVGLSNLINSFQNIQEFVFIKKEYTFNELNDIRKVNFKNNEKLLKKLKNSCPRFGEDEDCIIKLVNEINNYVSNIFKAKKNVLGGRYKFGLSSPSYITDSKNAPASFDGRKNGEPFNVHISTDNSNGYTSLINFASKIDYNDNRFNGNVVDFFVTPNFIKDNFDKFVDFLLSSIKVGFFEMQMNVVSSSQLIEARNNPDKFPNLVVRVWGFSAYFNDLPDDYKDYLIERALKNEGNS